MIANRKQSEQQSNEDIEMMETDDNCNDNTIDNLNRDHSHNEQHFGAQRVKFKRQYMDNNATLKSSLSKINEKNVNNELIYREILKAKRKLTQQITNNDNGIVSTSDGSSDGIICVFDTNIFLSNLNQLKRLIVLHQNCSNHKSIVASTKLSSLLVPWIVIQELDYQKTIGNSDSMRAISFINEQLRIKDGLIRGEKCVINSDSKINGFIPEEQNDDKIINCCIKQMSINESIKVILISNDINLRNKALINDINAMNWNEFYQYIGNINNKLISEEKDKNIEQFVSHCQQHLDEPKSKKPRNSVPSLQTNCDKHMPQMFSLSPRISFSFTKTFEAKSTPDNTSESTSSSMEAKPLKILPKLSHKKRHKTKISSSPTKYKEEYVIKYKYKCEQKLIAFIKEQYKSIWGEKDWKLMLEINLENATLRDMIRYLRKDWFSFSDYFKRDPIVKSFIDKLHIRLNQENTINVNNAELYKDLKRLMSEISSRKCVK